MRLQLKDVSLGYQRGTPFAVQALSGVSLQVEPGERLGIAGPVGSGKSSLLTVLAGLTAPDSGSVLHDGRVLGKKTHPLPGDLGLAFQSPEDCLFARTVFDDVAFAPRSLGLSPSDCRKRVESALAAVGLTGDSWHGRDPFSLSAGEQRRVALAGVLALKPRALLLDEPTASLDPATRDELMGHLLRLNEEQGTTIVIISHDMDEMAGFCQRLVIIDDGRIAWQGMAAGLLGDAVLLSGFGLEPPGTVELSRLLAAATGVATTPALSEDGAVAQLLRAAGSCDADPGREA
ncbi:MAG: ATP-binding cassette domain-containing protein [Thermoleophilia bacterium]